MEQVPSSDKAPENYDEYEFTLAPMYKEIASKILREDDNIRQQSLNQMREWIAKDPYILRSRTDSNFLLRFLRTKKFNVPAACAMLQKYLANRQVYPKWYKNLDCDDPLLKQLLLDGFFIPLPERDGKKFNSNKTIYCYLKTFV